MKDNEIKECVEELESINKWLEDGTSNESKRLPEFIRKFANVEKTISFLQLYLTIAGMEGMPKEKTKIQDNRNYEYWEDKGFNLARQECILALRIHFPNNTTLTRD